MAKRQTLKELAEALDLSVATVSRALGGYEDIALRTRERVAAKARELGYVPNSAARMLVSGKSGFVGLVVPAHGPAFFDSFLGQFALGLGEGLAAHGCDLFFSIAANGQSELDVIRRLAESGRVDGLVLTRVVENDARVRYLERRRMPFVTHGRLARDDGFYSWLDSNGAAAFAEAFERLYGLGHRRFGLISISESLNARRLRESGLAGAIAACGDPEVTLVTLHRPRSDRDAMRHAIAAMLADPQRPTAILGLFDELALLVLEEAARLGIAVPRQLSVIGFDNMLAGSLATPGLSTFDQDVRGSARKIADLIHQVMGQPDKPVSHLTRPEFVARGSHGPAPGS